MKYVFVLQHEYEVNGTDEIKFIGVFSTIDKANETIKQLCQLPGFRDHPIESFNIDRYKIDDFEWKEGFSSWDELNKRE